MLYKRDLISVTEISGISCVFLIYLEQIKNASDFRTYHKEENYTNLPYLQVVFSHWQECYLCALATFERKVYERILY